MSKWGVAITHWVPGCNNTRMIIKQRYIPLFVVRILRLTKVNGFHLYKINLICLLMYWGFLHFYNTELFDNCFFYFITSLLHLVALFGNFYFNCDFFACHLYYRPKRLSSGSPAPHFFCNFFSWLFPLWYSLAQHLLQNIFFSFFCFTLLLWFSLELRSSPTLWLQLYLKNFFSFLVLTQLSFKLCYSTFFITHKFFEYLFFSVSLSYLPYWFLFGDFSQLFSSLLLHLLLLLLL